ncbi:type 1 glutamine amidotransferase [Salinibacter altiplanensis]|uniref:type 1 glutamine amidotransferase n=1 Tax=Salinibacter altiplanensis TaxID=1803181 RepID=UPI000C9FC58E|nr:type 1 glutamine amidotransferase [Salinibacter altiplanensis]
MVDSPLTSLSLRALLVQCRSAPRMEAQEQTCFLERTRLRPDQLRTVNVARGGDPASVSLDEVDALLLGGAGKYSATQTYPWTEGLNGLIRRAADRALPTLGSCWGHQVLARALGGRVVHDPGHSELGCGWVELTEAGTVDSLFRQFSSRFQANMGHHDRVVELPPGTTELAHNDQPHQAFRLNDAPIYGTQFHSELDAKRERERILVYREYYQSALPDAETVEHVLDSLADTTEVDNLLYDFLVTFVARPHPSVGPAALLPGEAPKPAPAASTERRRSSPRPA